MNRYHTQKFSGQYKATIGADFLSKTVSVDCKGAGGDSGDGIMEKKEATLQIWDTAGQERFQSLGVAFYRGADVCLLTYDVTDPQSLEHLKGWRHTFLEQVTDSLESPEARHFPFVVMGNKVDKPHEQHKISHKRAEEWCREVLFQGCSHESWTLYEVSAKNAQNVDSAFVDAAQLALRREEDKRRTEMEHQHHQQNNNANGAYNPYGDNGYYGTGSSGGNAAQPQQQRSNNDPYANEYYNPATPTSPPYNGAQAQQHQHYPAASTASNYSPQTGYNGQQQPSPSQQSYAGQPSQQTPTIHLSADPNHAANSANGNPYAQPHQQLYDAYGRPVQLPPQTQQNRPPPCC
jgi:Ras-related protein Rab-7A